MSQPISLVFPHQLYENNPAIAPTIPVMLVEEWLFFKQYHFHKQKLLLHRASMQYYYQQLQKSGYSVSYIESQDAKSDIRLLIPYLQQQGFTQLYITDATDNWLMQRIEKTAAKQGLTIKIFPSPNFISSLASTYAYFEKKPNYFQTDFYIHQRKEQRILLDDDGKPTGGKWSFDAENRLKFPKTETIPTYYFPPKNEWMAAATDYVNTHFSNNYGSTEPPLHGHYWPCTHAEAALWLDDFIDHRLAKFGMYEDAIVRHELLLYHSAITPMLNIGLLHPQQIIDKVLAKNKAIALPLNAVEGFIRQIIGWREFMHLVYLREGSQQRNSNYWGFTRKIPPAFWNGTTGIAPVDDVIHKIVKTGYCHHIERLMVLGNFMLLCEFCPTEVYVWMMELFVDAYDWVMVPNVYGMTQFADGGLITTKPYISGSNYLLKMSNYTKGPWCAIWDALFWRFMHTHRVFFSQNPRLGMLLKTWDTMPAEKRNSHLKVAEEYIGSLCNA